MGKRKRVNLNIDEFKRELTGMQKIAFIIAEEKFGTYSEKNVDAFREYVISFDAKKEPYKSDLEKYMNDKVKKEQASTKPISYQNTLVMTYYYKQNGIEEPSWFKNRKSDTRKQLKELSDRMSAFGLACFYFEDEVYNKMIKDFENKYGVNIDGDYIRDVILGKGDYEKTYKDYFKKIYEVAPNKEGIDLMFDDYEAIVKRARMYEGIKTQERYDTGSLSKKETQKFLDELVTHEYDYTRKNKEEISKKCVNSNNKIDVSKVVKFVSDKVNRENNYESLVDATAALMELQILHSQRGRLYKFFRKSDYLREKEEIDRLKESMIEQSNKLTNNSFVKDHLSSENKKTVYSPRLTEERMSISIYVERNVKDKDAFIADEYEIINKGNMDLEVEIDDMSDAMEMEDKKEFVESVIKQDNENLEVK